MPILITYVNDVYVQGQSSITVIDGVDMYVTTDVTDQAGIGMVINPAFETNVPGWPIQTGTSWKLKWPGGPGPGLQQILFVQDPNDPSATCQMTLNVI